MTGEATEIEGVMRLHPVIFRDARGEFVKTFHSEQFRELGLDFEPREQFFSTSHRDVIRGMHFQNPPADHSKLIFCLQGTVLDVALDLRKSSRTFGKFVSTELSESNRTCLYIPRGCAHGFISLTEPSLVIYQTSTVHDPKHDAGVRWDSFGLEWPCANPILSDRDRQFPKLSEFPSPF
jgi:dTDP-4-dehydrorhamnose 3,5-epimerase